MTRRRDARRRAIDILIQAELSGRAPEDVLAELRSLDEKISGFTEELVRGVAARLSELDAVLGEHAEGWTVPRMAVVDRAILRVASHEILHREDVPVAVAIDEAVEAAKELSTEDSGRFVNGLLGRIAKERATRG